MANSVQLDNIKRLSDAVISPVRLCQQSLDMSKSALDALLRNVSQKEREFKIVEAEANQEAQLSNDIPSEEVANTSIDETSEQPSEVFVPQESVVEQVPEVKKDVEKVVAEQPVVAPSVEPAAKPATEQQTQKQTPPQQNKERIAPKQPAKPVETKRPAQTAPSTAPRVSLTSETRVRNETVKTYTDEKGNVRIRKFLDTSRPAYPPKTQMPRTDVGGGYQKKPGVNGANFGPRRPAVGGAPATSGGSYRPQQKTTTDFTRPALPKSKNRKAEPVKKPVDRTEDKAMSKKALLTRSFDDYGDDNRVVRKARIKKTEKNESTSMKIEHAIVETQQVPMKTLSEKIGVTVSEIIKQLFKEGVMKTINDTVDYDYAEYIAGLFGVTLELKLKQSADDILQEQHEEDDLPDDTTRPPIVTVMGHVDHGKTSLLDAIRKTNVTAGEAGGITQHIGAYTVKINNQLITFIDTPGHAAFTEMRARGAKITDVAIIVIAADDGIMQQTIEAINHAKAAEVSIVVAINKIDKPGANVERVKQQLTEQELVPEEWGGNTIVVPISAKNNIGIDKLLESVLTVTEIKDLKANPKKKATGTILESRIDKGRGDVATVLVSNGTLHIGDSIIAGQAVGKVRALFDDKGKRVKSAGPSIPVEVLGFTELPDAGDIVRVADEKLVKKVSQERKDKIKIESAKAAAGLTLNGLFDKISQGDLKSLNLIVKTDVQGSYEALKKTLEEISNDEVKINVIHGGVGAINETDIMLASASSAIVIGFNVRLDAKAAAEKEKVDVRLYDVIYDAVDDITKAMKGMLDIKYQENIVGTGEVRQVFRITGVGTVAGAYVTYGKLIRNAKARVYRNDSKIYEGKVSTLKRFNDDVKEVQQGYECGISLENYNDIKEGDVLELFELKEVEQA